MDRDPNESLAFAFAFSPEQRPQERAETYTSSGVQTPLGFFAKPVYQGFTLCKMPEGVYLHCTPLDEQKCPEEQRHEPY